MELLILTVENVQDFEGLYYSHFMGKNTEFQSKLKIKLGKNQFWNPKSIL
jgi:hypothetical protein